VRRRRILLFALALAVVIMMTSSAQVTPVRATASISPDPTWNTVYNGDFEQGTYSLSGGIGNCPNSWTQTNSYYDPSYRLTPHYDVIYDTSHAAGHSSPVDDNYHLEITASCAGDFWNNAWVEEEVYQNLGDHHVTQTSALCGGIRLNSGHTSGAATSGCIRVVIYCHDDQNGVWTWVQLDYRLRAETGSYNYGESRSQKIIDLITSGNIWEGVSDTHTSGYTGRNLYTDIHNKFDSEGYSNYYYSEICCAVWAKCVWMAGSSDTYSFDGVRIGEYPTPVASSASPTETAGGNVSFSWTCDTPTCMFQDCDQYGNPYTGTLRGGVNQYDVKVDSSHNSYFTSTSGSINFGSITRGRYNPYVIAQRVDNSQWGPSSSFSEVLDGYAIYIKCTWTNIWTDVTKSATLHYTQHGSGQTVSVGTSTVGPIICDPSSSATVYITAPSASGSYRSVNTGDTASWVPNQDRGSSSSPVVVNYYGQYEARWSPSGLGGNSVDVEAYQFGAWVDQGSKSASFDVWVDANGATNLKMDSDYYPSSTERYDAPTCQWTVALSSPYNTEYTATALFYHQWKPTVSLFGLPDSSHSVNATYTKDGSAVLWSGYAGSWSDWADSGLNLQFSLNSALSTTSERWHTYSVRSWTMTSAFAASVTYIHQYYVSLNPLDSSGNPLARSVSVQYTGDDGSSSSNGSFVTSFSALWSRWIDAGSTLMYTKLASGSSITEQWYCYNGSLNGGWREQVVSASATYTLTYYHQFRPDIELYSNIYGQKIYDNAWWLSPNDWVKASAYLNASDSHPPITGTYTFTFTDPSGVPHAVDGSTAGSCFYQIPQARGAWTLHVTWNDGSGTLIYNRTVGFHVWDYDVGFQSLVQSGNNLNVTVYVNQLSGATSTMQDYGYMVAVTGGSGSGIYTNTTGFTFANGFMSVGVSSVSTKFFFPAGMWLWSAHMINLDPYLAHVVGVRVLVVDPITGYIYANTTSTKSLAIGGESDITIPFSPSPSWYKHGLFRVYYTFLLYDVSGGTLIASKTVDYGNNSPLSWIMSGTGQGEIKSIYYFTGLHNSTTLTQVPISLLASYSTAHFYLAFEDSHALSTQTQVSPAVMHYMNITFTGGNVFATGCVPPSTWVSEGSVTLSVDSPFYPMPPYYSNTTRFIFLGWKWTYASSYPQWASCNSTTLIVDVTQPIEAVAYWRTQYLIEYTPYVPTTAPTDTVDVSYTVNATLTNMSVKSASTVSVWVDACTLFTMKDLWVNDYTWYAVNYDTPSKNVTGGASLTLPYVEKTNKVSNTTIESNNFEAGGTLTLNLTLTTTYFNAQWINVTVMVASENAVLVDRNGVTWSNTRIQLQNNTALITIPLPADIGNGTLTVILTAYGKVEPTTKQVTLRSPLAPSGHGNQQGGVDVMPIAVTVTSLGGLLGASILIRKRMRASRQRGDHPASNATATTTATGAATGFNFTPIINSLSGAGIIEFHEQRGPHLKTIIDRGSGFIGKLKDDPGMCVRHHGTRPLVIQDPEGEHVALLSYITKKGEERDIARRASDVRRSESRTVKNTLVLCSRERSGSDIMKLAEELSGLGNSRSIRLKLVSAIRNRSSPPIRLDPSDARATQP